MRPAALCCIAAFTVLSAADRAKRTEQGGAASNRLRIAIPNNPTQLNPILAENAIEVFAQPAKLHADWR
jgi:hypothetical protein